MNFDNKFDQVANKLFLLVAKYFNTYWAALKSPGTVLTKRNGREHFAPVAFLAINLLILVALLNLDGQAPKGPFGNKFLGEYINGYVFEFSRYVLGYALLTALIAFVAVGKRNDSTTFRAALASLSIASVTLIPFEIFAFAFGKLLEGLDMGFTPESGHLA